MSRTELPSVEGIVTSDAAHKRRSGYKKSGLITGVVILVIAAACGGLYLLYRHPWQNARTSHTTSMKTLEQLISAAQASVRSATTAKEKTDAYTNLGVAYMSNHQANQAIAAYQSALEQNQPDNTTTLSHLADAYYEAGQIPQEIDALQQLVVLLRQSGDPNDQLLADKNERLIQELQGLEKQ